MKKFKNQYILTNNQAIEKLDMGWTIEPFQDFTLHNGPDLPKYTLENTNTKLVLLGFAFSALDPNVDEDDILRNWPLDDGHFLDYLDTLCGNFLVIVEKAGKLLMYNDAAAVLKMFYTFQGDTIQSVASDPKMLEVGTPVSLSLDEKALEFYNSDFFNRSCIRLGEKTAYQNVKQVLPNHSLEVRTSKIERIFPREKMELLSIKDSNALIHTYFTNVMDAAAARYDIKCSLTAGWDSRIVAAFTIKHKDEIEYYTYKKADFSAKHHDLRVASGIAEKLGFDHQIIDKDLMMPDDDVQAALASYDLLERENYKNILGGYCSFSDSRNLVLIGNVSEICKNYYDNVIINDGKTLAQAAHFPVMDYTVEHFQVKYEELQKLEDKYGYDLKDIAHWEQDITNFAAKRTMYISYVTRAFAPFNCRLIIKTILSAPRDSRDKQIHPYYKQYLETYCPDLNTFPINPTTKKRLMVLGKKLGIYPLYKLLSTKLRK